MGALLCTFVVHDLLVYDIHDNGLILVENQSWLLFPFNALFDDGGEVADVSDLLVIEFKPGVKLVAIKVRDVVPAVEGHHTSDDKHRVSFLFVPDLQEFFELHFEGDQVKDRL